MHSEETLSIPKDFQELRNRCKKKFDISIMQDENIKEILPYKNLFHCYIEHYVLKAWILQFTLEETSIGFLIGYERKFFLNSSKIEFIDLENKCLKTRSGNVYKYGELLHTDPQPEDIINVCATVNHLTKQIDQQLINIPDIASF